MNIHSCADILAGRAPADQAVTVRGWVRTRRDSKSGLSFVHLSDGSCFHPVQIVATNALPNYATEVAHLTAGCAIEAVGRDALAALPASLQALPQDRVPLRPFDTVGLPALRALLNGGDPPVAPAAAATPPGLSLAPIGELVEALAATGHGLVMVMGKGGVGKTTVAAALAVGLVASGAYRGEDRGAALGAGRQRRLRRRR